MIATMITRLVEILRALANLLGMAFHRGLPDICRLNIALYEKNGYIVSVPFAGKSSCRILARKENTIVETYCKQKGMFASCQTRTIPIQIPIQIW